MRELILRDSNYCGYDHLFKVEGLRLAVCLFYSEIDDIFYGLQKGTMLKAHYTQEDIESKDRLKNMKPIFNGEEVLINGEVYITEIKNNYSDFEIANGEEVLIDGEVYINQPKGKYFDCVLFHRK